MATESTRLHVSFLMLDQKTAVAVPHFDAVYGQSVGGLEVVDNQWLQNPELTVSKAQWSQECDMGVSASQSRHL